MAVTGTYLDGILAHHRERVGRDSRRVEPLLDQARSMQGARGFRRSLEARGAISLIAEVKRRSPSKGDLNPGLQPSELASRYAAGGAACLSVLTDEAHFGGSVEDLVLAREAVEIPVLRKDFVLTELDVVDSRLMGADALLLIVAALDDKELVALVTLASEIGIDALVEAHDREEIARAVEAGATIIGINQRDLFSFEVDRGLAALLSGELPAGVVSVAESGIRNREDLLALEAAGYSAALVGEVLVTSDDPEATVRELKGMQSRSAAGRP